MAPARPHASASPFEALAERLNWVGADIKTDAFAQAMVTAGIPEATIQQWTKDPQVRPSHALMPPFGQLFFTVKGEKRHGKSWDEQCLCL